MQELRFSRGVLVLLAAALSGCSRSAPAPVASASADGAALPTRTLLTERTVLPLLDDPQPLVRAELPGYGEVVLLVDTGAEFSWLDEAFAARVGLVREPLGATLTDIQGAESSIRERALVPRLELGGLVVTEFKPMLLRTLRAEVEGTLGQDLLRMVDVIVDGPGGRLILLERGAWEQAIRELFEPGNRALAYTLDWTTGVPCVHVDVADLGGPWTFEIDTGSNPMSLSPELATALELEPTGEQIAPGLSHAGLTVPTYEVHDLAIEAMTVSSSAHEAPKSRLGWGVLEKFVAVFPTAEDKLLLFIDPVWSAAWDPDASSGSPDDAPR